MDYENTFQKLLKQMNNKKIDDITKKQYWETDIENTINNNSFVKKINELCFNSNNSNNSDNFTNLDNKE
tara:strand:- start:5146 stop:5352 length:207 start_codon:yes stop_codon:yes gene_type:complete